VQPDALLRALADGEPHSGEELARAFGVTRAAVWKHVAKLERWGVAVNAAPGRGYRLGRPLELLDARTLGPLLRPSTAKRVARLEIFTELDSTNCYLLARPAPPPGELDVCIAEYQTAGRGRRGRHWSMPVGGGLCLSAAWRFADTPPDLAALGLAVGVAARRAIAAACGVSPGLKWPNDLVWDERKLGGVLLELEAEAHGGCRVVAGVGLNVVLPSELLAQLSDWPRGAVDLAVATGGAPPSRTLLAARVIDALAELFVDYAQLGFGPYRADWSAADYLRGRGVTLEDAGGAVVGTALGVEQDGALVIETSAGMKRRVISGDVRVRNIR
jgi:BirA family transcriptional regulator, biotin operon repressor / biotin---[acetyl-CoA-carboxylase] ligase